MPNTSMSDAEATIKHAIISGLIQNWHKKNAEDWTTITRDEIFQKLFSAPLVWAVKEYIQENNL